MNLVHVLLGAGLVALGVNFGADLNSDVLEWLSAVAGVGAVALSASKRDHRHV